MTSYFDKNSTASVNGYGGSSSSGGGGRYFPQDVAPSKVPELVRLTERVATNLDLLREYTDILGRLSDRLFGTVPMPQGPSEAGHSPSGGIEQLYSQQDQVSAALDNLRAIADKLATLF